MDPVPFEGTVTLKDSALKCLCVVSKRWRERRTRQAGGLNTKGVALTMARGSPCEGKSLPKWLWERACASRFP